MNLGTLRFRLSKAFPGVDADLIDGWIGDVYDEILAVLPWSRTAVHSILRTTAPYDTGTVSLVEGSADVILDDGVWSNDMTGRAFRVAPRNEYYEFTYASPTTGTLDRPYEGPSAGAAGYSIFQTVYPLPADVRSIEDDAFGTFGAWWTQGPVQRSSRAELRMLGVAFDSSAYGWGPIRWATYMEDSSVPPRQQIEFWPIPTAAIGIPFTYYAEAPAIGEDSSRIMQLWMQPSALIEGTTAKIKRHLQDYAGGREHDAQYQRAVSLMIGEEARRMGGMQMELADYYTSHRRRRAR